MRKVYLHLGTEQALCCLQEDIDEPSAAPETGTVPPWITSDGHLLGALYVAHGAQFGRQQIRGHLKAAGFDPVPQYFLQRPDRAQWHALVSELERYGASSSGYGEIEDGARSAFSVYADSLDEAVSRHSM